MSIAATGPRLSQHDREGIRDAVDGACAETNAVWQSIVLFGSRTDPSRLGGDIDLLVTLDPSQPVDLYRFTQRLRLALEDRLGEQRIDLVVDDGHCDNAFPSLAREKGVELWSNR
jgi:predicted nucleotidyltransferase